MRESIEIRDNLSPREFQERYVVRGIPVMMRGLADNSRALQEWSLDFFERYYGNTRVQVTGGDAGNKTLSLSEYIRRVKKEPLSAGYLRDWTISKLDRALFDHLPSLPHFEVDFLRHTDSTRDMFKAIFIGPKGSSTPMHIDVWRSHAWMLVLRGQKRWVMVSPEDMQESGLLKQSDASKFHTRVIENLPRTRHVLFDQKPGDLVYIPHSWWHFVTNIETSVAVTYNYIDSFCIESAITEAARKVALFDNLIKAQCNEFLLEKKFSEESRSVQSLQREALRRFLQTRANQLAQSAEDLHGLASRLQVVDLLPGHSMSTRETLDMSDGITIYDAEHFYSLPDRIE